ncbi:hypothetical protein NTCA1_48340 [Novosphingobium sp. TCA1]|nr:hypothetical protein NTCA1_48340 [Novosphingobium sp. TCA1]
MSYRTGGWWFLPAWLPDAPEYDVGPFRTKRAAFAEAELQYRSRMPASGDRWASQPEFAETHVEDE